MPNSTDTTQANNSDTLTLQPMGFGEILDTIFSLYREHFLLFFGIISLNLCGDLVVYLLWRLLPDFFLKFYITDILEIPFALISMSGIIAATATIYLGKRITSRDALKQAWQRLWHILACHFLWSLVFEIPRTGILIMSIFMSSMLSTPSTESMLLIFTLLVYVPFSINLPIDLWNRIFRLMTSVMIRQMWIRFIRLAFARSHFTLPYVGCSHL